MQALATHIWRVAGDELRAYKGNYEEYLRQRAAAERSDRGGRRRPMQPTRGAAERDRERAREERRQRKAAEKLAEQAAALEAQIHALEARLADLGTQLEAASLAGDVAQSPRLGVRYQATGCRAAPADGGVGGAGVRRMA